MQATIVTPASVEVNTLFCSPRLWFRWRTALIIRELEAEVDSMARGRPHRDRLKELMTKKEVVSGAQGLAQRTLCITLCPPPAFTSPLSTTAFA